VVVLCATAAACGDRIAEIDQDFTDEVRRICVDNCTMDLACREPQWFDTYAECEAVCLDTPYIYNDTDCGQARRDLVACIGSTATCELYNDTNNVHADDYTCKAEKDDWLSLECGQNDEDPFPNGAP
jgi:hypothetical protein